MLTWTPFPGTEITFPKNSGEEWKYNGKTIALGFAHLRLREPGDEYGHRYFCDKVSLEDDQVVLSGNSPCGGFEIRLLAREESIEVSASLVFSQAWRGGADLLLLQRPEEFLRCRFYNMLVSGWSDEKTGIVFTPLFKGKAALTFNHTDAGAVQCLGLSCPAGIFFGERDFAAGEKITGAMIVALGEHDLWSPDIAGQPEEHKAAPKPAKPYAKYIELWHSFTRQPGLWLELGEGMGLFHRGWFNFLKQKKVSGVLWENRVTWDAPLCEIAWGGSANAVLMETMFRLGDPRGEKILNALLYFKNGGFMHENGSWINAYQAAEDKFTDRYGREHSETATGGVVNMMLWRCLKRGNMPEREKAVFTERLQKFCDVFLEDMTSAKTGGVAFGRYWDGSPGQTRGFVEYPEDCYPVSDAFAAFSYLVAHLLTGESKYQIKFGDMLRHLLAHLKRNEWRFLEYDTLGADAVAPSWILLVLDEVLTYPELLDGKLKDEVWEQYHRTWRVIHSFLRLREDYPDAEWKAAETWGGTTITQGGIIHGSTAGSIQGAHSVHLRYDFPLALGAYARRTGSRIAAANWESYLNWTTWLQYTDPRWPDIIGASTEHITFRQGYVQDTAQIKHGNPIAMLEWLECRQEK
jgi:hypothetical protein